MFKLPKPRSRVVETPKATDKSVDNTAGLGFVEVAADAILPGMESFADIGNLMLDGGSLSAIDGDESSASPYGHWGVSEEDNVEVSMEDYASQHIIPRQRAATNGVFASRAPRTGGEKGSICDLYIIPSAQHVLDIETVASILTILTVDDEIHIRFGSQWDVMTTGALISLIVNCKAKTVAYADSATSIHMLACMLSADSTIVGPYSFVMLQSGANMGAGSKMQMEDRLECIRQMNEYYGDIVIKSGIATEDEIKAVIEEEKTIPIYGDKLLERYKNK